jgi:nucleoside-diphosphate-sugar epimerase
LLNNTADVSWWLEYATRSLCEDGADVHDLYQPNGTLGGTVIRNLVRAGFLVTVVTRDVDKSRETWPEVRAILGDYTSPETLANAFRDEHEPYDSVVALLNRDQLEAQITLLDAAVLAKIPHIIPSEFGFDLSTDEIRSWPWLAAKVAMEDHLLKLAKYGKLTYTAVHVGAFFDWALERGILVNLLANGQPTMLFDGGNMIFDVTLVETIGEAVAAALVKHMEDPQEVKNKFLHVHTAAVTQQQLLSYARASDPDRVFAEMEIDTAQLYALGLQKYAAGERGMEINRLMQPRAFSIAGPGQFESLDNEYLGIPEWTDAEVETFIKNFISAHRGA